MCKDNGIVYNDLKAKNLVVRDGMHYGADFAIYEDEVPECHSYALVYVRHQDQSITAKTIVRCTRVAESVKKKAILALVDCENASIKYASFGRLKLT